jgi:large subunit ribosomal protein L15
MTTRTHKRKKSSRYHGRGMGSCSGGSRKNKRTHGHKGGRGMAGTGKRADHKKTLITKLYGNNYFGKQGITSKRTQRDIRKRINLDAINRNLESFGKKTGKGWEIELKNYKILKGDKKIKNKLIIKAREASESAIEQVKRAGGEIILPEKNEEKAETK